LGSVVYRERVKLAWRDCSRHRLRRRQEH